MLEELVSDAEDRMKKSIANLRLELSKLRTGRASTALLDQIRVDYYGTSSPLNQVSTVTVSDPRTISISPWDKSMIPVIEKAIMESDLGLNPMSASETIRVPIPSLTEERRIEITKIAKSEGENCKVAIRNIRRSCNSDLKEWLKEKEITEDDDRLGQTQVQTLTDRFVASVDDIVAEKEKEIMTV
ncbi:MAG: ribosome recycling factor [Gammaproteobacteria bacterium]|nr:ribosome recycling factor [Gammaproteobacteria bacterium]MYD78000.1 ribosome recycling factor [Gammaproteobacteria bacterium]MYI89674.1 ribosome recycling factor [Gammaproteobacteria bacterium]